MTEPVPDLSEDFGAELLDALEERGVRHAADVRLQDLACVAEELVVQVEDPLGESVRPRLRGDGPTSVGALRQSMTSTATSPSSCWS
jgi:hypothetical protein